MNISPEEVKSLQDEVAINMEIAGENVSVTHEMVDIRINAKEGFDAAYANNNFIVLNTTLTEDLIDEGIVRELISKVQNLRKTKDFNIVDRINIYISSDEDIITRLSNYIDYIKKETLCVNIINEKRGDEYNLNGINANLDVERV
jgi:isoleucyl-tRNA synthetase